MSSFHKKIIFITIVIIILLAIVFLFFILGDRGQRTKNTENKITKETKEQCVERISRTDDSVKLEEEVKNFIASFDSYRKSYYIKELFIKYIGCQLEAERDNRIYEQGKQFINTVCTLRDAIPLSEYLKSKMNNDDYFASMLIKGSLEEICPEKLLAECKEGRYLQEMVSEEWCNNICEKLQEYEKNSSGMMSELVNFQDQKNRGSSDLFFIPNMIIAYRFGGEEMALEFCNSLFTGEKETCLYGIQRLEIRNNMECGEVLEKIAELICAEQ